MRVNVLFCSTLFLLAGSTVSAAADYKVEDILKYFSSQEATRGICVGSEEECGLTGQKREGFNLNMTFALNSADLTEEAKGNLEVFAEALRRPELARANIAIDGFTDASGSEEYNQVLSERRAQAVVSFLTENGVDEVKLVARGHGETRPLGDPLDPANRRVETSLVVAQ